MTAAVGHHPTPPPVGCWCCGTERVETELVRLGAHPEVGLCFTCAVWVKRRAAARQHEQHPTTGGRLLHGLERVRAAVIARGWHERGRLGALLRRLDRHLP